MKMYKCNKTFCANNGKIERTCAKTGTNAERTTLARMTSVFQFSR